MLFMKLDAGAVLRKETGRDAPKIVRLLIGNPLIIKEMARLVPDAAAYAPVTILVVEQLDGLGVRQDGQSPGSLRKQRGSRRGQGGCENRKPSACGRRLTDELLTALLSAAAPEY